MNEARPAPEVPDRVFITGANGFIGRALARRYRDLGAEVSGIDFAPDRQWNVIRGDVRQPEAWRSHLDGADLVLHTAAAVSMVTPMRVAWDINCNGTRRLLVAARECGVKRVVHLSSVSAFGFDFPDNVDETHPLMAIGNAYADTKIASEHTVLAAHAAGELACTVIRPADVYGPGARVWIAEPLKMIDAGQFLLPANGKGIFSPVYIDDLVDGIVLAASKSEAAGHIFNLSGGVGVPCEEFFSYHWRWQGKSGDPRSLPAGLATVIARTVGATARLFGSHTELGLGAVLLLSRPATYSIEKARRLLGYEPSVDLAEGMRRSEIWAREQGLIDGA